MVVELEWRFDTEVPDELPREEHPPHRPRRRVWLGLAGAVLLLVGVGLCVWWRSRREVLATVEAEVQAVAQLELGALADGDVELFMSLQDDADPTWREAQGVRAALDTLLPPPVPGLAASTVLSVENARVVGDVARVEMVRMAGLPGGEMVPFRAVRFYRRSDDGRWLHTRADPDYMDHIIVWRGQQVEITSFAADAAWMEPVAPGLEGLAERFCVLAVCRWRAPLTLVFTGTLDAAVEPWLALPAPFVVGAPRGEAARAAWKTGLQELLLDRLIAREVGQSFGSDQGWPRDGELFSARFHEWLRAELGLSGPLSPDLDLISEALDAGEWISLEALWYFTPADDDPRRPLAEAEIDLLLAFIEEEYGRSQVVSLLHAPREAPRMEPLIWEALHGGWPAFERRYVAYVREVIGRPSSPLATLLPSQSTIWWWPARGPRVSGGCAWTDRRCRPEGAIPPTVPLARPAS